MEVQAATPLTVVLATSRLAPEVVHLRGLLQPRPLMAPIMDLVVPLLAPVQLLTPSLLAVERPPTAQVPLQLLELQRGPVPRLPLLLLRLLREPTMRPLLRRR